MKRILCLIMSLLMCMSLAVPAAAAEDAWNCIEFNIDVESRLYKQTADIVVANPFDNYVEEITITNLRVIPEDTVFTVKNADYEYDGIYVYFTTFTLGDGLITAYEQNRTGDDRRITIDITGKYYGGDTVTYLATKPDPDGHHISAGDGLYWRFDDYVLHTGNELYSDGLLLLQPGESVSFTIPNPTPNVMFSVFAGYVDMEEGFTYDKQIDCVIDDEIFEEDAMAKADAAEQNRNPFDDINPSHHFYDAVLWAYEDKITTGLTDRLFGPTEGCTRAQVMTFLWRAAGCPEPTSTANPFTDVKESHYFYKAVLWAVENGITTGTTGTTFGANESCSYAHTVTFLWRANGEPAATGESPLAEQYSDQWYTDAIAWADTAGLLSNTDSSLIFIPDLYAPRCEIVYYLYLLYDSPEA